MKILKELGIKNKNIGSYIGHKAMGTHAEDRTVISPIDGEMLARIGETKDSEYAKIVKTTHLAHLEWRNVPAPQRGEIVRQIGVEFRNIKPGLAKLVSLEMGKSYQEALGEVQEIIDICDFAVGLSRQLYGLSMHSERPFHRLYEQWHPLGVVGIISAFNFPVAVWSWNAMLAWVCGNTCIWKPSEKTPLSALACQIIAGNVLKRNKMPAGVSCLINGDHLLGKKLAQDKNVALISATGSTRMGKSVAQHVAARLGKYLLELGGNNAIILTQSSSLEAALVPIVFGAVGTAAQRCTSTRRLIIHASIYEKVKQHLIKIYQQLKIGNPLVETSHVGPLIDKDAVKTYLKAIEECKQQGGHFCVEGQVLNGREYVSGCYVKPCIAEVSPDLPIVRKETFAPILYIMKYHKIDEAITMQNSVPQGLSSSIMSSNLYETELFLSAKGSDCGIANVNIGTSGAEIGGAFGGEKETGGGRESGSDAWKAYMRRQTVTVNTVPESGSLAQGIQFSI